MTGTTGFTKGPPRPHAMPAADDPTMKPVLTAPLQA
jgi:hypothetical protein